MAQSVIGALRVSLGLDSAQFQQGLKQSETGMQKFAKAAAIGFAAAAAAATGAFMAISGAAQRADQQMKASQSFGIPIEQLGRLAHAAELSGSSMEEIGKVAQRTSRAVNDAMNGVANAGTRAFEQVGVALKNADGSGRDVEAILGDVAEQFANMPDGAQKTALAIEMFGRSGANLIPLLNQGREGLQAMGDEAERLGLVFDERTARASEQFNDNLLRLNRTMTGLWNQVLANVISGFAQLTDKIIASRQAGGGLDMAVMAISAGMNILVRALGVVVDNFETLIAIVRTFVGIKIVMFLASAASSMIAFARTVRTLGAVMLAVTTITRAKMTAILLLAAAIAEVTGTTRALTGWISTLGETIYSALPPELRAGIDGMRDSLSGLLGDIDAVDAQGSRDFAGALSWADEAESGFNRVSSGASNTAGAIDLARDAAESFGEVGQQVTSTIANSFTDMFMSAIDGSKSLIASIGDLLKSLGRLLLNNAFNALFGGMFGGGGFALPSFNGGGFTGLGARAGGLDGKGGFLAMMHPNETVVDHTRGQGAGRMHITTAVAVDGTGSITSYVKSVVQDGIEVFSGTLPQRVQRINADPRGR